MRSSGAARVASAAPPAPAKRPLVWLLMGTRAGDNNQLLALAEALEWPFEVKKLDFNQLRRLAFLRDGLTIVERNSRDLIKPPWPDVVIGVGYGSVPVARYIRDRTEGRTKLIHIGNPRDPLPDFDLQITTPQYSRQTPNLLELPFPIGNPARMARPEFDELKWLQAFPRPRRLIAVGGPARHWELDHQALVRAIRTIQSKDAPSSLIVAVSPRTRNTTRRLLEGLASSPNEAVVDIFPRFGTLLATSDEIYVTADSVSMLSEAVLSGKPVGIIPIRRSFRGFISHWLWERPTGRGNLPNFPNFWALLDRRRLVGTVELPVASRTCDTVERAAEAVRAVVAQGSVVDKRRLERSASDLGTARSASRRQQPGSRIGGSAAIAVRDKTARV
jgi:mitochondrial fission protein ELM1